MVDTEGAGAIDTVAQAVKDFKNPEDWAMDGIALGLDGLGVIANPLGSLASAGIGWLIEHLSFLKEPLDDLAGDPKAISGIAATWGETVQSEVKRVGAELERASKEKTAHWKGDAADGYRTFAADLSKKVNALGPAAQAVSEGVQGSGQLVATVRGIIRDLIADVVAEIVIAAAAALASSWFTLGGSVAAFTGWAVARGAATAGKISGKIAKLLSKLSEILGKFNKLRDAARALAELAQKFKSASRTLGHTAARGGKGLRSVENQVDNWNNSLRTGLPQSVTDRASKLDDAVNIRNTDGYADTINPRGAVTTGATEAAKERANADENYDDAKQKVEGSK